jgi:Tol biopolymer transport system component
MTAAAFCAVLAMIAMTVYFFPHIHPAQLTYTQLTDFTDSATAPALSPDGRMVAFIRGSVSFLTADQIYVKVLPHGEARRLTEDDRLKYSLSFSPDGSQIAYTVLPSPVSWATSTRPGLPGWMPINCSSRRSARACTWESLPEL